MNKITFEELTEMVGRLFAKLEKIEALTATYIDNWYSFCRKMVNFNKNPQT